MTAQRASLVFIHGFRSSAETWSEFVAFARTDPDLAELSIHCFEYATSLVRLHPLRRIPSLNDIADSLRTFLEQQVEPDRDLVLVAHSQGGLIAQRYLARALNDGRGEELARIRQVIMFACPNSGSEFAAIAKGLGLFRKNPQVRDLEPLSEAIVETRRVVLERAVHATEVGPDRCPVRISAYAGQIDAVVTPTSARDVFPTVGVLPGDHFSILKVDSHQHPSYVAFKHDLTAAWSEPRPPVREPEEAGTSPRDGSAEKASDGTAENQADSTDRRTSPAPPPRSNGELVDRLLEVPGMTEPDFRQQLFDLLPLPITQRVRRNSVARLELFNLIRTCRDYRHLRPGSAVGEALTALIPDHPPVAQLAKELVDLDDTNWAG